MSPYRTAPIRPGGSTLADALPVPWWRPFRRYRGLNVLERRQLNRLKRLRDLACRRSAEQFMASARDDQVRAAATLWGMSGKWIKMRIAQAEGAKRGLWTSAP